MLVSLRYLVGAAVCALAAVSSPAAMAQVVDITLQGGVKARLASFELPGQASELRSIAAVGRGGVFMLVGTRPEEGSVRDTRLLSLSGNLSGMSALKSQALRAAGAESSGLGIADDSPLAGALMAADGQGTPYTVSVDHRGAIQLTRFGSSGRAEQAFNVALEARSVTIRRFAWIGGGNFLIIGSAGSAPLLAAVDIAGRVRQRHVLDDIDAAAVAAVPMPDGSIAALIEKGTPEEPRYVVALVQPAGAAVQRVEQAGRPLDLAVGAQGQLLALVERRGVSGRDLLALAFSAGLQPLWQRTLYSEVGPLSRFRALGTARGDFVVAGRKDRGLWVSRLSGNGAESWTSWTNPRQSPELEITLDVDMARSGDDILLGYSAMVVRDRRQSAVVRVVQFRLD